ncbi:DUF883 family protein [Neorhizobium sp. NPDC001467]|uniref:DUF883 family protein n=1 Tax=Neorhizobium sp. NPDC001467 TaxID=3390595 RepID=UPI003D0801BD
MAPVNPTQELPDEAASAVYKQEIELQLSQLREDIAVLARTVAAAGSQKAEDVGRRVRKAKEDATDASLNMVEAAREQALSLEKDLERQIRAKPLQSVGIAAGVGFLFALLARR